MFCIRIVKKFFRSFFRVRGFCIGHRNRSCLDIVRNCCFSFDDFDDFDEDLEDEDFSSDSVNSTGSKNRPYVSIDIDNAKEIIGEKVIETLDKTKEKLEHFNVSEKIDKAKEIIGEMTSPSVEPVYKTSAHFDYIF